MSYDTYLKEQWKVWEDFIKLSGKSKSKEISEKRKVGVPYVPIIGLNFNLLNGLLRDFVLNMFGSDASMLTIIKGSNISLYEEIKDGYFVYYKWFKTDNHKEVKKELAKQGKEIKLYKQVSNTPLWLEIQIIIHLRE